MAKVLLVEDDNNLREIYEARLLAEGYTINSAKDGEEALVVAKAEKPDLIISDVMMPKISGFEMLDILRNTQGLKETKVIMLTALGQADDRTRADSLGADRYLVKSQVTLEDIVKAAHELLEGDTTAAATTPLVATAMAGDVAVAPIAASAAPVVATTPTPQMAVSEPPATPAVAPEPTALPEPPTDAPVPEPATAEVTPAAEPIAAAPEPAAPTATPEPAEAPASELPTVPAEDAAVAAPEVAEPAAEAPAPVAPELPATESTAEEQATVDNQIEDFIKNNAVEVPAEAPTPPPNETTDRVMQESVDTLIASTEHDTTAAPQAPSPEAAPAEEPAAVTTPTEPPQTQDESSDGVTIAHKKVIARPEPGDKPDLGELLAREEAKTIVPSAAVPDASATIQNDTTPAPTQESVVPPAAPLPGNTFSPTNGTVPPKPNDETDPNSIAL